MYYVYIIRSKKEKSYYIGYTSNLEDRINRHNQGRSGYTKRGIPWELVYFEECKDRREAMKREKEITSYKGGEGFKKLLSGDI